MHFSHAVVLEEDTGVGVDIWPWVFGFAHFEEDVWDDFVDLADESGRREMGEERRLKMVTQ